MTGRTPGTTHFDPDGARRALRRRRRRRRVRRGLAWMVVSAIAVVAGMGVALGWNAGLTWVRTHTRIFEVQALEVSDTDWVPPWELAELCGVHPGDDILAVDPDSVAVRLAEHPRVDHARVTRTWHRTVRLTVTEKAPVALLVSGRTFEIAADGTVLGPPPLRAEWPVPVTGSDEPRGVELPLLTGVDGSRLRPGNVLEGPGVRRALTFLTRLRTYGCPGSGWLSEVWVDRPEGLVAVTLDGTAVRIGDGRLSARKVEALMTVLKRMRDDGRQVEYVDARFRNQVIVKEG